MKPILSLMTVALTLAPSMAPSGVALANQEQGIESSTAQRDDEHSSPCLARVEDANGAMVGPQTHGSRGTDRPRLQQ